MLHLEDSGFIKKFNFGKNIDLCGHDLSHQSSSQSQD